jgi:hypothetical protein
VLEQVLRDGVDGTVIIHSVKNAGQGTTDDSLSKALKTVQGISDVAVAAFATHGDISTGETKKAKDLLCRSIWGRSVKSQMLKRALICSPGLWISAYVTNNLPLGTVNSVGATVPRPYQELWDMVPCRTVRNQR